MKNDIFSFRIVDLSHYMTRPIYGLDPCFSEFRAKEIKSVPIIRIFGSNSEGVKTCLHIHGVLPYFYIPYDSQNKEFEKFVYQLCENLDKALNVSLGQSSSQTHHIFKVQLVKAFPFYGYHRKEHLFLKIYMYNPRLLKRAANLLQNGALNGKSFQAFDSHVPYRLQFLIDFNLFPMSFLHVPFEMVKVRKSEDIPIKFKKEQVLGRNVEKMSTSKLEVDISAAHILNRIQLQNEMAAGKKSINPGIESIWQDEAVRRKLLKEKNINLDLPILEIPPPEPRPGIKPTDSEIFYRSALERKLIEFCSQTSDSTVDNTLLMNVSELQSSPQEKKSKFNVTRLLKNSIYPEECIQNADLLNGTLVQDHLTGSSDLSRNRINVSENIDDKIFDEDTLDEEEILTLSQHPYKNLNETAVGCEESVLDFIKQLDMEDEENPGIDMNSSLAPFSEIRQNNNKEVLQFLRQLDDEDENIHDQINNLSNLVLSDSEDECLNDFTIANEDIEEVLTKLSQSAKLSDENSISIPQTDGADDDLYTPSKCDFQNIKIPISPNKRSPRTPRSAKRNRYKPLQGISTFSPKSVNKNNPETSSDSEVISASSSETYRPFVNRVKRKIKRNIFESSDSLSKHETPRNKLTLRSKSVNDEIVSVSSDSSRKSLKHIKNNSTLNLDKTEIKITCNLKTPKRSTKNNNELKMLKCKVKLKKSDSELNSSAAVDETEDQNKKVHRNITKSVSKDCETVGKKLLRSRLVKSLEINHLENFSPKPKSKSKNKEISQNIVRSGSANCEIVENKLLSDELKKSVETNESETDDSLAIEDLLPIQQIKIKMKNDTSLETDHIENFSPKPISKNKGISQKIVRSGSANCEIVENKLLSDELKKSVETNESETDDSLAIEDLLPIQQIKIKIKNDEIKSKNTRSLSEDLQTNEKMLLCSRLINSPDQDNMPKRLIRTRLTKRANSVIEIGSESSFRTQPLKIISEHTSNNNKNKISAKSPNSQNKNLKQFHVKIKKQISTPTKTKSFSTNSKTNPNFDKTKNKASSPIVQPHVFESLRALGLNYLGLNKPETLTQKDVTIKTNGTAELELEYKTDSIKKCKIRKCKVQIKRLNIKQKFSLILPDKTKLPKNVIEHDEKLNYTPTPGTSKDSNSRTSRRLVSYQLKDNHFVNLSSQKSYLSEFNDEDESEDLNICSFYETSLLINDSPSMFSDNNSPIHMKSNHISEHQNNNRISRSLSNAFDLEQFEEEEKQSETMSPLQLSDNNSEDENTEVGKNSTQKENEPNNKHSVESNETEDLPLSINEILQNLPTYYTPECVNQMPFYSDPNDVRKAKEIGNFALHIPLLQIHPEMPSILNGPKILKTKDNLKNKTNETIELYSDDESPIKIRRQKVALILNESGNESADENDTTLKSLSCSPLTPKLSFLEKENEKLNISSHTDSCITPKSSKNCRVSLKKVSLSKIINGSIKSSKKKKKLKRKLFKTSQQSNETTDKSLHSNSPVIRCVNIELLLSDDVKVEDAIALKDSEESQIVFTDMNKSLFKPNISHNPDSSFGLSGATLNNTYGFKANLENLQQAKADVDHYFLTTMTLEVFVKTRGNLHPNPAFDEICGVFYAILNDVPEKHEIPTKLCGYILLAQSDDKNPKLTGVEGDVTIVHSEEDLFANLLNLVRFWDPDILAGYEIELSSWGYILDRSKALQTNYNQLLSRVPSQKVYENIDEDEPKDVFTDLDHESKIFGRILLDVWRLLRSEIALTSYSFENVMYHISHRRIPKHNYQKLTEWYLSSQTKWIVLEYYLERVNGVMELLDQLDLIGRTCEMSKLIGIQFYEILSRGSQYRVESMMLRIAKPKNLIPMSPSPQQRLHMRAPEYLPLILEPQSRFYADPLIVLDFQSLYPSIMIAYNYCFSTCLGRVEHLGISSPFEFGVSMLRVSPTMLRKLIAYDMITISPCGAVFVKQTIREGILPQMVREILDTRLMVKKSMKLHKTNQVLQRVLHSRQLALKLMANVTYGYTAANFSGRMPCVEVGDSVVAKGRETLERAIKLVEATPRWGAEVVYGDTDSLFILCPGKTRETAFKIGEEIAEAVTKDNPYPVKLKLEKVYQPSILQTKKRYVGYMYETPDQTEPIYEAKGIETVRRDGCPAVVKMLEKSLRILFETKDVSKVKQYVCRQFSKILQGKANIQDLIFAKEFRGRFGYKPGACVPALELTRKWMLLDPRKEPRRGERVPYIVTNGPPGLPIIRLIRCPHDVLNNEGLKINAIYYITRAIIPALNRCFLLIGADINEWFAELPRKNTQILQFVNSKNNKKNSIIPLRKEKKTTISQYFSTTNCAIDCGKKAKSDICNNCMKNIQNCIIILQSKISKLERAYYLTEMVCQSCTGRLQNIECTSLDCPVLYVKEVKSREYKQIAYYNELIKKLS